VKRVLQIAARMMMLVTVGLPYWVVRPEHSWGFIPLCVSSAVTGFLCYLANGKEGDEARLFLVFLLSILVACVLWCLTFFIRLCIHVV